MSSVKALLWVSTLGVAVYLGTVADRFATELHNAVPKTVAAVDNAANTVKDVQANAPKTAKTAGKEIGKGIVEGSAGVIAGTAIIVTTPEVLLSKSLRKRIKKLF